MSQTPKERFRSAELALIAALNGLGRPVGNADEIVALRRELLRARHECQEAGLEVETIEEWAQKDISKKEAMVRGYAAQAMRVIPLIPRAHRLWVGRVAGLCAFGFLFGEGIGAWVALAGAGYVWGLVYLGCAELFPTPAIRVARMACALDVDVRDLWPEGSSEQKDYLAGYQMSMDRRRWRGDGPSWIKIR